MARSRGGTVEFDIVDACEDDGDVLASKAKTDHPAQRNTYVHDFCLPGRRFRLRYHDDFGNTIYSSRASTFTFAARGSQLTGGRPLCSERLGNGYCSRSNRAFDETFEVGGVCGDTLAPTPYPTASPTATGRPSDLPSVRPSERPSVGPSVMECPDGETKATVTVNIPMYNRRHVEFDITDACADDGVILASKAKADHPNSSTTYVHNFCLPDSRKFRLRYHDDKGTYTQSTWASTFTFAASGRQVNGGQPLCLEPRHNPPRTGMYACPHVNVRVTELTVELGKHCEDTVAPTGHPALPPPLPTTSPTTSPTSVPSTPPPTTPLPSESDHPSTHPSPSPTASPMTTPSTPPTNSAAPSFLPSGNPTTVGGCPGSRVTIELMTDGRPEDTSWELMSCLDHANTTIASSPASETYRFRHSNYSAHALYEHQVCVPAGARYVFAIKDWRRPKADGICCEEGQGHYKVSLDGTPVAEGGEFEEEEATAFGADTCPVLCHPGQRGVEIDLRTGPFPQRVQWGLREATCNRVGGGRIVDRNPPYHHPHTLYRHGVCISDDPTKEFTFSVGSSDGRGFLGGYYKVSLDGVQVKEDGDHASDDGATIGGKCPEEEDLFCPDGMTFELEIYHHTRLFSGEGTWSLEETCGLRPDGARYQGDLSMTQGRQRICLPRFDDSFRFKIQHSGVEWYQLKLNGAVVHRSFAPAAEEEAPVFGHGCPDIPPVVVDIGAAFGDHRYVPRPARLAAPSSFSAFAGRACVDAAADLADTYGRTPQQCAQACSVMPSCAGFLARERDIDGKGLCMLHAEDPRQECKPARDCHRKSDASVYYGPYCKLCPKFVGSLCEDKCEGSECVEQFDCEAANPDTYRSRCHECPGGIIPSYQDDCLDPTKCTGTGCRIAHDFNAVWKFWGSRWTWNYADDQWWSTYRPSQARAGFMGDPADQWYNAVWYERTAMPAVAVGRRLGTVPEKVGPSKETRRRLQNGSASGGGGGGGGGGAGGGGAGPTTKPTQQVGGGGASAAGSTAGWSIIKLAVNGTIGPADLERMCNATAEHAGGHGGRIYSEFNECEIYIPPENTLIVAADPNVRSSEPVGMVSIPELHFNHGQGPHEQVDGGRRFLSPSGPWNLLEDLWHLDRMDQCHLPLDGEHTRVDASGVRVYVVDTGVWGTHEDLVDVMAPRDHDCHANFVSLSERGRPPAFPQAWWDLNGHGTHVAGTICGTTTGVAMNCELCSVRVLDADGGGSSAWILAGLNHIASQCHDRKCVVNMSLGGGSPDHGPIWSTLEQLIDMGVVMVVASGNDNEPACHTNYGAHPDCFTVGSTRANDLPSGFSNYGPCINVWAPGTSIYSAAPGTSNNYYATMSGTSMASPAVAGLVAHVMSTKDDWALTRESAEAIKREVKDNAVCTGVTKPIFEEFTEYEICVANAGTIQGLGCNEAPTSSPTGCPDDHVHVTVNVRTDDYGIETRWELEQMCNGGDHGILLLQGYFLEDNTSYTHTICVPDVHLRFRILDDYGDGICCYDGDGTYSVYKQRAGGDDELVVQHDTDRNNWVEKVHDFGVCPDATGEPTGSPIHPTPPPTPLPTTLRPTTSRPTHPPVANETLTVDAFMFKFLFSAIEVCIDPGREDECESRHQCAYACSLLDNCVGFARYKDGDGHGGIFYTVTDDYSCNDDLANGNANAIFYERSVDMKFNNIHASTY